MTVMKTILVPTDFSENSKAGLKFALNWSQIEDLKLVFIYVVNVTRNHESTEQEFQHHFSHEMKIAKEKLDDFLVNTFENFGLKPSHYSTEIVEGFSADIAILGYCEAHPKINYICISTRGAGGLKKMLGTNTGNLITNSEVPVIAVPQDYNGAELKKVLYASDLKDYDLEIKKVIDFAKPLKAEIEILHFSWPYEELTKNNTFERDYDYGFKLSFPSHNVTQKLIDNLHDEIKEKNPSVFIMFTNQDKNFWERIFSPSKTEQLSFEIEVPMLVFRKEVS